MLADPRSRWALLVSLAVHVALALGVSVRARSAASGTEIVDRADQWGGDTFEVDALVAQPAQAAAQPAAVPLATAGPTPERPAKPPSAARIEPAAPGVTPEPAAAVERRPREEAAPAAPADSTAGTPGAPAVTGTTFGAAGLPPGVRNLGKAFTRALPVGARADAVWLRLASGGAGAARIVITVDEEGQIQSAEPSPIEVGASVPAHLRRLLERTIALLRAGRFALDHGDRASGSETLRIDAQIEQGPVLDEFAEPGHTVQIGFEPPSRSQPGKAWFAYASGRRVELRVTIEAP